MNTERPWSICNWRHHVHDFFAMDPVSVSHICIAKELFWCGLWSDWRRTQKGSNCFTWWEHPQLIIWVAYCILYIYMYMYICIYIYVHVCHIPWVLNSKIHYHWYVDLNRPSFSFANRHFSINIPDFQRFCLKPTSTLSVFSSMTSIFHSRSGQRSEGRWHPMAAQH